MVNGLCSRSASGRKKVPFADGRVYLHRECLAIESEQRLKGEDVVMLLNRIEIQRGIPKMLYCDNGSEFSSQAMDLWAYQNRVRIAIFTAGEANG